MRRDNHIPLILIRSRPHVGGNWYFNLLSFCSNNAFRDFLSSLYILSISRFNLCLDIILNDGLRLLTNFRKPIWWTIDERYSCITTILTNSFLELSWSNCLLVPLNSKWVDPSTSFFTFNCVWPCASFKCLPGHTFFACLKRCKVPLALPRGKYG